MIKRISRRSFIASTLSVGACSAPKTGRKTNEREVFVCPPCGCSKDHVEFSEPGQCPDCGMILQPSIESNLGFEPKHLVSRAGFFRISGGAGRESKHINVHYYMPDDFSSDSPIMFLIPGAGRNSAEYRNAWLPVARSKAVLIVGLGYPENGYDFASYHMGGVVKNIEFGNPTFERTGENARVLRVEDESIQMEPNPNKAQWIFSDFDRLFKLIVSATGSKRSGYDIFGHSAGAQILHRMALFYPDTMAQRIVAANAGFYTLPDLRTPLPFGVAGSNLSNQSILRAFAVKLTILLGEADNSDSSGGTLLRTLLADKQGLGRYARGRFFYAAAKKQALESEMLFNWGVETVPDVGHDFVAMSTAAARILYSY